MGTHMHHMRFISLCVRTPYVLDKNSSMQCDYINATREEKKNDIELIRIAEKNK